MYTAIDRKSIDGFITSTQTIGLLKLHEVVKYCAWEPIATGAMNVCMNLDVWNSLPADIRTVLQDVNAEARYRAMKTFNTQEQDLATLRKAGIKEYYLSQQERERWHKIGDKFVEDWILQGEAKGAPARAAATGDH